MFKFIKQYAETMDNATIYPMISLFIFFIFFVVLLLMVKKMRRERVEELSNIPFDKEEITISTEKKSWYEVR
jgi:cytochrome c oxidase cbb3-type subunit 4